MGRVGSARERPRTWISSSTSQLKRYKSLIVEVACSGGQMAPPWHLWRHLWNFFGPSPRRSGHPRQTTKAAGHSSLSLGPRALQQPARLSNASPIAGGRPLWSLHHPKHPPHRCFARIFARLRGPVRARYHDGTITFKGPTPLLAVSFVPHISIHSPDAVIIR